MNFQRIAINRQQLFLDLDGVFCDFERGVSEVLGVEFGSISDHEMWIRLNKKGIRETIYEKLPEMPGARALWNYCEPFSPVILTGVPSQFSDAAETQKRSWVSKHLGRVPVICCSGADKARYIQSPGDVLVDDREKNRVSWVAAGGIFILHQRVSQTINELKRSGFK